MKRFLFAGICALSLAACTTATVPVSATTVATVQANVQLFCNNKGLISAMATSTGSTLAPVIAKGASSAYVTAVCAAVGAIAVAPPANASSAPVLVIPSVSIPLRS